jgi:putative membrane protein
MSAGQLRRYVMLAAALLAGCGRFRQSANAPEPRSFATSDGNIAAMLLAANSTDISYAKLVPGRSLSPAVQDFARRMIVDHGAVTTAMNELIARTKIQPEENNTSLDFRDESTTKRDLMRDLGGRQFDSTYIANEIEYHTKLLKTLDDVLIPRARDAQLRQVLVSVRPAVASHLMHAQRVQAGLR